MHLFYLSTTVIQSGGCVVACASEKSRSCYSERIPFAFSPSTSVIQSEACGARNISPEAVTLNLNGIVRSRNPTALVIALNDGSKKGWC